MTSKLPSVSFVCSIYNKEYLLPQVIEALLNQTGSFEKEYIFINDGSTDKSLSVLKTLTRDLPNLHIIDQPNKCVAYTVQRGIALASNEFIKFVEADDILLPYATESLLNACLSQNCAAATGFRGEASSPTSSRSSLTYKSFKTPISEILSQGSFLLGNSTSLIQTKISRQIHGIDTHCVTIPDLSLSLRYALNHDIALVNGIVVRECQGISNRLSSNKAQEDYDSAKVIFRFLESHFDILSPTWRYELFRRALKHLWKLFRQHLDSPLSQLALRVDFFRSKYGGPLAFSPKDYLPKLKSLILRAEKSLKFRGPKLNEPIPS